MSATITLHPASRDLLAAVDWGWSMLIEGYDVRLLRLHGGDATIVARPKETAHTNANVAKIPRYHHQYGHSALPGDPDLPPDAA